MEAHSNISLIVALAVILGYINHRFIKLQATIAIMASALVISIILIVIDVLFLHSLHSELTYFVQDLHFKNLLFNFMLGLLLFAGALSIDLTEMRSQKWEIMLLAIGSTVVSAFLVGTIMFYWLKLLNIGLNYSSCLLFGALISPTDPIAVLAIFKKLGVPKNIQTIVAAESLLNDGVGVVMFITAYHIAFPAVGEHLTAAHVTWVFFRESVGGIIFGLIISFILYWLLKAINDHKMEILLTIGFVLGGYAIANAIDTSGLLAMVTMGIFIANYDRDALMSAHSRKEVDNFWEVIDELLNAILFLLIGLEILVIQFNWWMVIAAVSAILTVLVVRYFTVAIPLSLVRIWRHHVPFSVSILTWGGLRGGLAVALALGIPNGKAHDVVLCMTYGVVLFSVLIQGLSMGPLVRYATRKFAR